jgi:hypothetical protein
MRCRPSSVLALLTLACALTACGDDSDSGAKAIPITPEAADRPDPRLRRRLEARAHSTDPWSATVTARPGQLLRMRALVRNLGETASGARARVELDRGLGLIGVSKYLRRADQRSGGRPLKPGLTRQGVVLGTIVPGTPRLVFSVRVANTAQVGSSLRAGASIAAQARRAADTAVVRVVRG